MIRARAFRLGFTGVAIGLSLSNDIEADKKLTLRSRLTVWDEDSPARSVTSTTMLNPVAGT